MSAPVVELRSCAVVYDGRAALTAVDLRVEPAELVAVLGANGSGKSTLVRTLLGLVPLAAGELAVFGTPLARFSEWRRIGYVPQRTTAATGVPATVREVVTSGRLPMMSRWRPASTADRRAVDDALDVVGLRDRAGDNVATLSGGQQQRVLIARALTCAPDLLVLDEPTSGVDLASQQQLATSFGRLLERGTTILLVAHELGPLHPYVHRAVVLQDGRKVHDGAPPALDHLHSTDPEHAHPPHDDLSASRGGSPWGLR